MAESTIRQKKAARLYTEAISENGGERVSKGKILKESGYSKEMAKNPKKVFETQGFREAVLTELEKAGVNDKKIAERLNWLLEGGEDKNHIATTNAIKEVAKITGLYAPTKTETKTDIDITQTLKHDKGDYLEFLKEKNKDREVIDGEIIE